MTLIDSAGDLASPALPYSANLEIVPFDDSTFESANLPAQRLWTRHFDSVCFSFERHIDDRFAPTDRAIGL